MILKWLDSKNKLLHTKVCLASIKSNVPTLQVIDIVETRPCFSGNMYHLCLRLQHVSFTGIIVQEGRILSGLYLQTSAWAILDVLLKCFRISFATGRLEMFGRLHILAEVEL